MNDSLTTTVTKSAGIAPGTTVDAEILKRRGIFERTQIAEDAVLAPADPGGLPTDLRHALAARIAELHGERSESARYGAAIVDRDIAALGVPGSNSADPRIAAMLRFTDAVSTNPRDMVASDVAALQAAGVTDADIVRLAELNAFLAYQLRVIAGLRVMVEASK